MGNFIADQKYRLTKYYRLDEPTLNFYDHKHDPYEDQKKYKPRWIRHYWSINCRCWKGKYWNLRRKLEKTLQPIALKNNAKRALLNFALNMGYINYQKSFLLYFRSQITLILITLEISE